LAVVVISVDLLVAVLAQRQLFPQAAFVQRRLSTAAAHVLAAEVSAE
jgi:hypothetical protein